MDGRGICRGKRRELRDKTKRSLNDVGEGEEGGEGGGGRRRRVSYGNGEPSVSYIRMTRRGSKALPCVCTRERNGEKDRGGWMCARGRNRIPQIDTRSMRHGRSRLPAEEEAASDVERVGLDWQVKVSLPRGRRKSARTEEF